MSLTFDTDILFYAADISAGIRHETAFDLVDRATRDNSILTLQSLAEFYASITRKGKLGLNEATSHIEKWQKVFPVVAADIDCFSDAMWAMREHQLSFWDALIWATAKKARCRLLITEDFHDGQSIGPVTFIDPFQAHNEVLLRTALPPFKR